jgi:hypothetical protein
LALSSTPKIDGTRECGLFQTITAKIIEVSASRTPGNNITLDGADAPPLKGNCFLANQAQERPMAKKEKKAKGKAAKVSKKRVRTAKTKTPKATAPGWTPSSGDPSGEGQGST